MKALEGKMAQTTRLAQVCSPGYAGGRVPLPAPGGPARGNLRSSSRGQVIALTTVMMIVLIGFVALAVDVGLLWTDRRHMQTAADAAPVAASRALRNSQSAASTADSVASDNGFTSGTNGTTITVNNPPSSGLSPAELGTSKSSSHSRSPPTSCACSVITQSM